MKNCRGNEKLIERLEKNILAGRVSHAYIFEGDTNSGKLEFARWFLESLKCEEVDILHVSGSGKTRTVKDADVVELQQFLSKKPVGNWHAVIVENADTMTLRAQNRLLKTLEEPPASAVIIILSENIENLTQTVLSRCVKYRLESSVDAAGFDADMDASKQVNEASEMILSRVPFYELKPKLEKVAADSDTCASFLDVLESRLRNLMIDDRIAGEWTKNEIFEKISDIEEARRQISRSVSRGYALKGMALKGR